MRVPYRKPGKQSQITLDPLMTSEKLAELQHKLNKLKKIQPQAVEEVKRLAELGDFSENVEYQLAKGRLRGINNAILRLDNQLHQAIIITPQIQKEVVQLGNTVTVENEGKQKIYQILGSSETDPKKGIISYNSPLGEALVGHKVSEVVTLKLAGKEAEYRILKIE